MKALYAIVARPGFREAWGGIPGTPSVDGAGPLPYSFFWFLEKSKGIGGAGRPDCTPAQGCIGGTPLRCHVRYLQAIVSISARPDPGLWRLSTEMYWKRSLFAEGAGSYPTPLTLDSLSRRETRHGLSSKVPSRTIDRNTDTSTTSTPWFLAFPRQIYGGVTHNRTLAGEEN